MNKIKFLLMIGLAVFFNAQAADTYDATKSTLTISVVKVGETYYSDVIITLGKVVSVGSASSSYLSYDTYTATSNQLAIPQVTVGSTTYYNVVVTVGGVLSVGGTCASLAACTSSSAATDSIYYTPAPFASIIQTNYQPASLASASSFVNRSRYMISDASTAGTASNYLSISSTYSATTGYAVASSTLSSTSTYNDYLSKLVQVVSDSSGYFRIDSHLHPNNSIDFDATDSNKLKFRNNSGKISTSYGYVAFEYSSSTKLLQAKKRYIYSYVISTATNGESVYTPTWTEDTSFSSSAYNYYVSYLGGVYELVSALNLATPFYLYNSPIDLGIPSFMNPNAITFVTNGPAPFITKVTTSSVEGTSGSIYVRVSSTYRNQIATAGSDAATKINADAYLATIKTAVEAAGGTLRYSTDVYTAFRDGALASKLVSNSISDGTPGQNLVPYVYFTNEKDTSGVYHPFMVVINYGNQASPNGLVDIPHPPGDSSGAYTNSKVTRYSSLENYITKIPMKNYGQVTAVDDNTFTSNQWLNVPGTTTTKNVYTYSSGDNGLLIDGSVMFPTYNNTLIPAHVTGELSASGCHVGQGGGGPHCHADGYQSGQGLGLYNDADYLGRTHPPLIGFGYDGIALFGIYRSTDTAMRGYSTSLDAFGAHDHDSIGYHYHAHTVVDHKAELLTYTTTMHVLMKGAYIGKTNSIPCFSLSSTLNNNPYLGGTVATSARIC